MNLEELASIARELVASYGGATEVIVYSGYTEEQYDIVSIEPGMVEEASFSDNKWVGISDPEWIRKANTIAIKIYS